MDFEICNLAAVIWRYAVTHWFLSVVGILVTLLIYDFWKKCRCVSRLGLPGPYPLPVFGNMFDFFTGKEGPHMAADCMIKKYGKVFALHLFNGASVVVADTKTLRKILVKDFGRFHDRPNGGVEVGEPFASMLTSAEGQRWKSIRSAVSPCFTGGRLRAMMPSIKQALDTLEKKLDVHSNSGEVLDAGVAMQAFALDVILSVAFGKQTNCQNDPDDIVAKMARDVTVPRVWFGIFTVIPFFGNKILEYLTRRIFADIVQMSEAIIKERRQSGERVQDFLQLMLDSQMDSNTQYHLTDHEVTAQSIIFLLAGYETTSATLTMALYCLAVHKEKTKLLQEEADAVLSKGTGDVSYEDLRELSYMDAFISEVLRLYPPGFMAVRNCTETFDEDNCRIEKGSAVIIPVYVMHHSAEYFPEPEEFRPERFLGEESASRDPYAYLPFGLGPRNCVGMRFALMGLKLAVARLISMYNFDLDPSVDVPVKMKAKNLLVPSKTILIKLSKRN